MQDNHKVYIEKDKFANFLGLELITTKTGYAKTHLSICEHHTNGLGSLHGAVIFSMADITFAAACNTDNATAIGIQAEIRYLARATGNNLTAEATQISSSKRLGHYQVIVRDDTNTNIAQFSATAYKLVA